MYRSGLFISNFDYGKALIRRTDSKSKSREQNRAIQSLATCARIQKGVTLMPSCIKPFYIVVLRNEVGRSPMAPN
jgi:hypothetical protein